MMRSRELIEKDIAVPTVLEAQYEETPFAEGAAVNVQLLRLQLEVLLDIRDQQERLLEQGSFVEDRMWSWARDIMMELATIRGSR